MNNTYHWYIPNAPPLTNIGDAIVLENTIKLLKKSKKKGSITLGTNLASPHLSAHTCHWSVYDYLTEQAISWYERIRRVFEVIVSLIVGIRACQLFPSRYICTIIRDFSSADSVFFVGNGYLRSKSGTKQALNLLLLLLPYLFAKKFSQHVIIGPCSIGPFAYFWQKNLVISTLEGFDHVFLREAISYTMVKSKLPSAQVSLDFGLFTKPAIHPQSKRPSVGFVVRNWYDKKTQSHLEKHIAVSLFELQKKEGCDIVPIVQVYAPTYPGEDDARSVARTVAFIEKLGGTVQKTVIIQNSLHAISVYGQLRLLMTMRLHAGIIALSQYVPVFFIPYEHKTYGTSQRLLLESWVHDVAILSQKQVTLRLLQAYKQKNKMKRQLLYAFEDIVNPELKKWEQFLKGTV